MSGHSKWSTIKRKKGANDAARAKIFTKIGRELAVAVKNGGPDPSVNTRLKDVIAKAKQNNVPNDNIERMLKKAAGDNGGADYEEIIYEGYGPSGVAVIVEALTDNRNRTAGEVRHYFDKAGGNMGTSGSVTFMFSREGVILIEKEDTDEDALMMDALDAGATDFITDDEDVFEIRTEANDVGAIREDLEAKGYTIVSSDPAYIPSTYTRLENPDDMMKMSRMIDMFEENDDVQAIWHNWENEDEYEG
jgi:YebC/PmpR family DNA-binding regulatory protein